MISAASWWVGLDRDALHVEAAKRTEEWQRKRGFQDYIGAQRREGWD